MASFFNEAHYLSSKVKQLAGTLDADGKPYTTETVKVAMASIGMNPEDHYKAFGHDEKLNPNSYFNETEYLSAKLKSLQETDSSWSGKSISDVADAMKAEGLTPAEHYENIGAFETTKDGSLLNPSNGFDANAYFAAKLAQLIETGHPGAEAMTVAQLVNSVKEAGFSPVSHYVNCGAAETADGVALVQTVPVTQRVANDPTRVLLGENVPSNYNPATPGATTAEAKPGAVTKPADVGGMADKTVSPTVTPPSAPVKVPGDSGYKAPPANIVDTNDKPVVIVPGKDGTEGSFGVLNPSTGDVNGIKPDGTPSDDVIGKDDGSGTITPPATPTPPSGGGGGGVTPPAVTVVELDGGFGAAANTVLTVNVAEVKNNIALGFKDSTPSGETNLTLTDGASNANVKLSTALAALNIKTATELDLSNVKVEHDKFVTIDLADPDTPASLALVKGTASQAPTGGGEINGGDIIKVEAAQVASGGKFGSGADAANAGIQAGAGDDILVVTDAIAAAGLTFGHIAGIETVVNTVDASATLTLDYTKITADSSSDVTALIKGSNSGGNITTIGVEELMLDNLTLTSLAMTGLSGDVIIEGAGLNITELDLDGTTGSGTKMELSMDGTNIIGLKDKAGLGDIATVTITSFNGAGAPDVLKIAPVAGKTDDVVTLRVGAADLLDGSITYKALDASGGGFVGGAYTDKFNMEIGFDSGAVNLAKVYGLDTLTLSSNAGDNTIFLGKNTDIGHTITDAITIENYVKYASTSGDKIDVKADLGISGGSNVHVAVNNVTATVKAVNILTSATDVSSQTLAMAAINAAFTIQTVLDATTETLFVINGIDSAGASGAYIYHFKNVGSAGVTETGGTELTLLGVVKGATALTGDDFVAA